MIESLVIKKDFPHQRLAGGHLCTLPFAEFMSEIKFTDGLNIIVGPNGSGKSSLLQAISTYLAADEAGFSLITQSWLQRLKPSLLSDEIDSPIEVTHDGQPIVFADSRKDAGWDRFGREVSGFEMSNAVDAMNNGFNSSGEKSVQRTSDAISVLLGDINPPEEIGFRFDPKHQNSHGQSLINQAIEKQLKGTIPKGKQTVIFDEPESGLGLLNQIILWKEVLTNKDVLDKFQIIVVSHCHSALDIEGANYIELKEGYLNACLRALNGDLSVEVKSKAAKTIKPLDDKHLSLMMQLKKKGRIERKSENSNLAHLVELGYVDYYTQRVKENHATEDPSSHRGFRWSRSRERKFIYNYHLTTKGKNYLKLLSES